MNPTTPQKAIEEIADATEPYRPTAKVMPEMYQPFPVDVLPNVLSRFITEASAASGYAPVFAALPLLAGIASAIGNSHRMKVKNGWSEPAVVWAVIVGDSGTMKSPAIEAALEPLRSREKAAMKAYGEAVQEYKSESKRYAKSSREWDRGEGQGEPPVEPVAPTIERCTVEDTTVEALAMLLMENPRGLLLARDELAGWFASFGCYNANKGGDVAKWLEMFRGQSITVDRKGGQPRTVYIERASVSVAGGIQPGTLMKALSKEHFENGLAARLLMASPPRKRKRWTEAEVSPEAKENLFAMFEALFAMEPDRDVDGEPVPHFLQFTPDAKAAWVQFYEEHAEEQEGLTSDLSAVWSKLEGYAARLAMVIHLARVASGENIDPVSVDRESMEAGITLSRWSGRETTRIYATLREREQVDRIQTLVEKIKANGGSMSKRELMRSAGGAYATAKAAKAALDELAELGYGTWETVPPTAQGGTPSERFVLTQ